MYTLHADSMASGKCPGIVLQKVLWSTLFGWFVLKRQSYLLHCIISYINLFLCDLSHFQTGIFFALYYIFTYKFINDKVMHMCMHTLILSYYITHMCTCITHTHTHTHACKCMHTHMCMPHTTHAHTFTSIQTYVCMHAGRKWENEHFQSLPITILNEIGHGRSQH